MQHDVNAAPVVTSIAINSLQLNIKVGWGDDERKHPQSIRFDVKIRFSAIPDGCVSDDLEGTVSFDTLADVIKRTCLEKEFRLLEYLGATVFNAIKAVVPQKHAVWLRVTKEKSPISNIRDGASFSIGEWLET